MSKSKELLQAIDEGSDLSFDTVQYMTQYIVEAQAGSESDGCRACANQAELGDISDFGWLRALESLEEDINLRGREVRHQDVLRLVIAASEVVRLYAGEAGMQLPLKVPEHFYELDNLDWAISVAQYYDWRDPAELN